MVAKVLFLVLLGTALAFATPIPAEDEHISVPTTVQTIAKKIDSEDSKDLSVINESVTDQPLETVIEKYRIVRFFKKSTLFLKETGKKLIEKGQHVLKGGKALLAKLAKMANEAKRIITEFRDKVNSKEVKEMVASIKSLFTQIKDTGSEALKELNSTIKDIENLIKEQAEPTENEKKID